MNIFEQNLFFQFFFASVQIYMKDAESKEKSNFRFFRFLFFELSPEILRRHHPNFRWFFHDNSKHKYRKKIVFFFSFSSAHSTSSMKTGSKLKGHVTLHILNWEKACNLFYTQQIFNIFWSQYESIRKIIRCHPKQPRKTTAFWQWT